MTSRTSSIVPNGTAVRELSNRVQISSDSLTTYVGAVERAFGADVDYGQIVKFYDAEPIRLGRRWKLCLAIQSAFSQRAAASALSSGRVLNAIVASRRIARL
jgi:hypothetical protein